MNGNNIFIDTNIALYLLSGDSTIEDILNQKTVFISFVTELELLSYKKLTLQDILKIDLFLADVTIIDLNAEIKKITIELRKTYSLKLPDAIIAASSYHLNCPFLTADKKLSNISELDILLYQIN